jgi:hypothetical protein
MLGAGHGPKWQVARAGGRIVRASARSGDRVLTL